MYKISTDIYNLIKNSNIIVNELGIEKSKEIFKSIQKNYINMEKENNLWLWEKFNDYEFIKNSNGWTYIQNFVSNSKCIIFFNQDEETKMFSINNGKDLYYILSETCGYEFYIIDEECTYLICFNHHDILYGCGNAIEWIETLK